MMLLMMLLFGQLPQTLNQSQSCSSYRPITLLNINFKILSKAVALCLESVLPLVVHSDQPGFVQSDFLKFKTAF